LADVLSLLGVLCLIGSVFFLGKHTPHKTLIKPCLELQHLLQPALVVGDVVAVFLGKRLIDAGLVNAGQQRLQRSNIADIGFQAVPHTVDQAAFFQHDRMGAALFLAGRTIIVVVLLAVCTVGLAGHAASAAPADQNTGEQVHRILVGRSAGIQSLNALHQLKILTGNQRFMGIRDAHPLGGGALLHLLDLVMRRTL
ncbi:imidazoleglycerol-phosphate dehydratase HisB, partial [Dysosmobacter welbionis]